MAANRCSSCSVNWPANATFSTCPECGERTSPMSNASPIPASEAKSRMAHADFHRRYAKREDDRRVRGEPSPEDLGAAEAQQITDLEVLYREGQS